MKIGGVETQNMLHYAPGFLRSLHFPPPRVLECKVQQQTPPSPDFATCYVVIIPLGTLKLLLSRPSFSA